MSGNAIRRRGSFAAASRRRGSPPITFGIDLEPSHRIQQTIWKPNLGCYFFAPGNHSV